MLQHVATQLTTSLRDDAHPSRLLPTWTNIFCRPRVNPRSGIESGISRFPDAQLRIYGLVLEPGIGPRIARSRWHHPGMRAEGHPHRFTPTGGCSGHGQSAAPAGACLLLQGKGDQGRAANFRLAVRGADRAADSYSLCPRFTLRSRFSPVPRRAPRRGGFLTGASAPPQRTRIGRAAAWRDRSRAPWGLMS